MFRLTDKRNLWRIERVFVIEFEQQLELLALVQRAIRPLHVNGPPERKPNEYPQLYRSLSLQHPLW